MRYGFDGGAAAGRAWVWLSAGWNKSGRGLRALQDASVVASATCVRRSWSAAVFRRFGFWVTCLPVSIVYHEARSSGNDGARGVGGAEHTDGGDRQSAGCSVRVFPQVPQIHSSARRANLPCNKIRPLPLYLYEGENRPSGGRGSSPNFRVLLTVPEFRRGTRWLRE